MSSTLANGRQNKITACHFQHPIHTTKTNVILVKQANTPAILSVYIGLRKSTCFFSSTRGKKLQLQQTTTWSSINNHEKRTCSNVWTTSSVLFQTSSWKLNLFSPCKGSTQIILRGEWTSNAWTNAGSPILEYIMPKSWLWPNALKRYREVNML